MAPAANRWPFFSMSKDWYARTMIRTLLVATLALGAPTPSPPRATARASRPRSINTLGRSWRTTPAAAPLGVGFRQTENAVVGTPGAGLWQSATALGKLQRRYFDAVSEQAGYFGTIEEAAGPAIVTLRLKVEDRQITEAEWVLNRKDDPGLGPLGGGQANAAFYDPDTCSRTRPPSASCPKPSATRAASSSRSPTATSTASRRTTARS